MAGVSAGSTSTGGRGLAGGVISRRTGEWDRLPRMGISRPFEPTFWDQTRFRIFTIALQLKQTVFNSRERLCF
jgi:ribosomal protein L15